MEIEFVDYESPAADYELLPDNKFSNVLASSLVIAGAHKLYGFVVNNTNSSAQYLLLFDTRTLPADNAVPVASFTLAAATDKCIQWLPPRKMLEGIVLCNSSTPDTKTIGSADCFFDVQYG